MIEVLIAYIQDKGFTVDVMPGALLISKQVGEEKWSVCWAISPIELSSAYWEVLTLEADEQMEKIDRAVAEDEVVP